MRPGSRFSVPHVVASFGFALALTGCVTAPVNADRNAFSRTPSRNAIPSGAVDLRPAEMLLLDVRLDRQVAENGCGAHAVAALVDYWRRLDPSPSAPVPATGVELYVRTPPNNPAGYSLAELAGLLGSQGLEALVVTSTPDDLKAELREGRPTIIRVTVAASELRSVTIFPDQPALLARVERRAFELSSRMLGQERLDHYWLVIGFDDHRVVVLDPAMGVRSVSPAAFEAAFAAGGLLAVVSGGWRRG